MSLIEFKNLPDTSTPLTAENLNNNFEYLDDKIPNILNTQSSSTTDTYSCDYLNPNILLAVQSASVTTGNNTNDKITLVESSKIGNLLSISNGGIKIGAGISYIKVSADVIFSTVSNYASRHHLQIYKNNLSIHDTITRFSGNWETLNAPTYLIPVQENDIIYLYIRTQDSSGSIANGAYLLIEAVR